MFICAFVTYVFVFRFSFHRLFSGGHSLPHLIPQSYPCIERIRENRSRSVAIILFYFWCQTNETITFNIVFLCTAFFFCVCIQLHEVFCCLCRVSLCLFASLHDILSDTQIVKIIYWMVFFLLSMYLSRCCCCCPLIVFFVYFVLGWVFILVLCDFGFFVNVVVVIYNNYIYFWLYFFFFLPPLYSYCNAYLPFAFQCIQFFFCLLPWSCYCLLFCVCVYVNL